MAAQPSLEQLVAGILRIDPGQITDSTSLEPLAGSLNRAKLSFALQRLGTTLPDNWIPGSFGELAQRSSNGDGNHKVSTPQVTLPALNLPSLIGTKVGVDIEKVADLPEAADYWEHDFYRKVFTRAELAYCLMADMPRTHLAGIWCAKEALRKCDDQLLNTDLDAIQISHNGAGRPLLEILQGGEWRALPAALSISHTEDIAMAVVVMQAAQEPARPEPKTILPPPPAIAPSPKTSIPAAVLIAIALIGLLALVALIRTFGAA